MSRSAAKDLTRGSPMKLILGFMLPLLLGMLFQQFYNMVDTMIVGKYLGPLALAGVGSTGSINFCVLGFVSGLCAGFAIPVAQKFGAENYAELKKYVGATVWVSVGFAVVLTAATSLLCGNILTWMKTPSDAFSEAYNYIFVIFLGIPVTILYNILSGFIRSIGDSKTPVVFLMISSVLNIFLDIFTIVVLKMGVRGAALATVVSQLVSGILCLVHIVRKCEILHIGKAELKFAPYYMKRLCAAGLPMGLQYSITAIGSILVQTAVNGLGSLYMAAITAGGKVRIFMSCPFDAMGSTMATYGGQNVGAGKPDRIKKGLICCSVLGVGCAALAFAAALLFGENLASLFLDMKDVDSGLDPTEILRYARQFLVTTVAFYTLLAFVNIVRFLIQGMGFQRIAVYAGVAELVARGLAALVLVPRMGFTGVCFADPAAWLFADLFLIPVFVVCFRKIKREFPCDAREPSAPLPEEAEQAAETVASAD